jgi:hypothetical protein
MERCFLKKGFGIVLNFISLVVAMYLFVGLMSLLGVAIGQESSYAPFWHEPWKQLFRLLPLP